MTLNNSVNSALFKELHLLTLFILCTVCKLFEVEMNDTGNRNSQIEYVELYNHYPTE